MKETLATVPMHPKYMRYDRTKNLHAFAARRFLFLVSLFGLIIHNIIIPFDGADIQVVYHLAV